MADLLSKVVGSNYGDFSLLNYAKFSSSLTAVLREINAVDPGTARRLDKIRRECVGRFAFQGEYERMNNRTVAQIFAEYKPTGAKPVAAGEVEGMRFSLYKAPDDDGKELE